MRSEIFIRVFWAQKHAVRSVDRSIKGQKINIVPLTNGSITANLFQPKLTKTRGNLTQHMKRLSKYSSFYSRVRHNCVTQHNYVTKNYGESQVCTVSLLFYPGERCTYSSESVREVPAYPYTDLPV